MEPLTLVGTVHLDPAGHDRLYALLQELKPETITTEVSQYALEYRRTAGPELLSRLEPYRLSDGNLPRGMQAVLAQLMPPYEYTAADAFADRTGAQVILVGDGSLSRQLLDRLEKELVATDNLVLLATREEAPLAEQVEREWARARKHFSQGPTLDSHAKDRLERINRRMARQIRLATENAASVHVGGWEHLVGLAELLADRKPEVRLLNPS